MKYSVSIIVYPEGDTREIEHSLQINQIVDLNGYPLSLPLPSPRIIAYRVYRKSSSETRNEYVTSYFLEQLGIEETAELT